MRSEKSGIFNIIYEMKFMRWNKVPMNTIYYDADICDDQRREMLYAGQLFVYSPTPS